MNSNRPERFLLIFICLLVISALVWPALLNGAYWDYHVNGTYYVINTLPLILYAIFYCCLLFVLYKLMRRKNTQIHPLPAWLHITVTGVFIAILLCGPVFTAAHRPRRYLDYSNWEAVFFNPFYKVFGLVMLLFIFTQLIFFGYFIAAFISGKRFQDR